MKGKESAPCFQRPADIWDFFRAKHTRPVIGHRFTVSSGFRLSKASEAPTRTSVSIPQATQAPHPARAASSLQPGPPLLCDTAVIPYCFSLSAPNSKPFKKILLLNISPNCPLFSTLRPAAYIWIILQGPVPSFLIAFSVARDCPPSIYPLYHQGFPFRN